MTHTEFSLFHWLSRVLLVYPRTGCRVPLATPLTLASPDSSAATSSWTSTSLPCFSTSVTSERGPSLQRCGIRLSLEILMTLR